MAKLVNRAKVSTTTAGTGTITLGPADPGFQTFADAGVADGDVVRYVIEDGTSWEIGTGAYAASGTTLTRNVLESSNSGAAISLSGLAKVFVAATAQDIGDIVNPRENRVIDCQFQLWRQATSGTGDGYVASDLWRQSANTGTVTQSRQEHPVGTRFGNNAPRYFLRQSVTGQSGAGAFAHTTERIEGVSTYAGQDVTVAIRMRRSAGSGNAALELEQVFGTGGSPSATISAIGVNTIPLTADLALYAFNVSVPSIAGKTLGTNNNDYLSVNIWASGGSDFNARTNSLGIQTITVDIAQVFIRPGTWTAADMEGFIAPTLAEELTLANRYFRIVGHVLTTTSQFTTVSIGDEMRDTPVIGPVTFDAGTGATFVPMNAPSAELGRSYLYQNTNHSTIAQARIPLSARL